MVLLIEVPQHAQIKKVGVSHLWRKMQATGTYLLPLWFKGTRALAACRQLKVLVEVQVMMLHPIKQSKPRHQPTDPSVSQSQVNIPLTHFEFTT